jgi:hypothetical protein
MSAETSEMEFDLVVRRARAAGFYVNRHKAWDPTRGDGGDLYMMPVRKFRSEQVETVLKYSTVDQVHEELGRIERQRAMVNAS